MISSILDYFKRTQFFIDVGVFLTLFVTAKLGQYILFNLHTSPALIWPPVGIAFAAVILWGNRMWVPIFFAQLLASLTSPAQPILLIVLITAAAYALQPLVGRYVLRLFDFTPSISRIRDALLILGVGITLPILAPAITTFAQYFTGTLATPLWISLTRGWAGGVESVIILTPLLTSWLTPYPYDGIKRKPWWEKALASLAVAASTYLVFWTHVPEANIFIALYLLFAPIFWIGLRMGPRIMTLAMFIIATLGVAGSIVGHPFTGDLGTQLFADELFILLIAPIFFILSTLVEERRIALYVLNENISELQSALEKISEEDRAKNDFLAILAHELRNPLASIVTNLEVAKMQLEEAGHTDTMHYAQIAISHVSTMTKLLDDMLDVSRISRKEISLRKEAQPLQPLISHAVETVEPHFAAKRQEFFISMPQQPIMATVDPLRFEQIIVNLLTNASKYCHQGGRIELSLLYSPERGIRINVRDNGVGIADEMLEKIFDPFTQVKQQKGRGVSAGIGIGLSLTKQLVELHQGKIWAESEGLGKGSDFILVLPPERKLQDERALEPVAVESPEPKLPTKKVPANKPRTILIVDDNKPTAYALQLLLERNGHTVRVVHDGESALEEMRRHPSDVLLLDIGMPGMDGYELAGRLRGLMGERPMTLIALTGYGQKSDKERAMSAGFNFHLTKPVGIAQIETLIATL